MRKPGDAGLRKSILCDQDGPGAPGLGRRRTVNDENLVRVGFEQLQDAVADGHAFVDPVPVAMAVF
jgi:hypothetical protein